MEVHSTSTVTTFKNLKPGDTFQHGSRICLKLSSVTDDEKLSAVTDLINYVDLYDGYVGKADEDIIVIQVKLNVTVASID